MEVDIRSRLKFEVWWWWWWRLSFVFSDKWSVRAFFISFFFLLNDKRMSRKMEFDGGNGGVIKKTKTCNKKKTNDEINLIFLCTCFCAIACICWNICLSSSLPVTHVKQKQKKNKFDCFFFWSSLFLYLPTKHNPSASNKNKAKKNYKQKNNNNTHPFLCSVASPTASWYFRRVPVMFAFAFRSATPVP